jgi:hypothetical protein
MTSALRKAKGRIFVRKASTFYILRHAVAGNKYRLRQAIMAHFQWPDAY